MNNKYILPSLLLCSFASQSTLAETQAELVKDIWQGSESSVSSSPIITINNKAFFFANDGEHGKELWQSDGTATGTKLFLISKNLPPSATKPQFWVPYQLQQPANAQAMF